MWVFKKINQNCLLLFMLLKISLDLIVFDACSDPCIPHLLALSSQPVDKSHITVIFVSFNDLLRRRETDCFVVCFFTFASLSLISKLLMKAESGLKGAYLDVSDYLQACYPFM